VPPRGKGRTTGGLLSVAEPGWAGLTRPPENRDFFVLAAGVGGEYGRRRGPFRGGFFCRPRAKKPRNDRTSRVWPGKPRVGRTYRRQGNPRWFGARRRKLIGNPGGGGGGAHFEGVGPATAKKPRTTTWGLLWRFFWGRPVGRTTAPGQPAGIVCPEKSVAGGIPTAGAHFRKKGQGVFGGTEGRGAARGTTFLRFPRGLCPVGLKLGPPAGKKASHGGHEWEGTTNDGRKKGKPICYRSTPGWSVGGGAQNV